MPHPQPSPKRLARVVVHDYLGHPFPVQLSRELARRGHQVLHAYCSTAGVGRGRLHTDGTDPGGLTITGLPDSSRDCGPLASSPPNDTPSGYTRRLLGLVRDFAADVVLSGNTAVSTQRALQQATAGSGVRFVYWLQDLHAARSPTVGSRPDHTAQTETRVLRDSDAVIAISASFAGAARKLGVAAERIAVLENWAPLSELSHDGVEWGPASADREAGEPILLYAGTLDARHETDLLARLAKGCDQRREGVVHVVSQGSGRAVLERIRRAERIERLRLHDFQAYEQVPRMFAAADVLLAGLSTAAEQVSVPSKVLAYLCAERPVLAAIPPGNRAAQLLSGLGAGVVVNPHDQEGYLAAAFALLADPVRRRRLGRAGRSYAESAFSIGPITDRFERILTPSGS